MRNRTKGLAFFILLSGPCALWATTDVDYRVTGMALYRAGQYVKAVNYFKNAIKANPKDWKAYEDLGSTYEKLNDPAEALAAYRKSLRLNPSDANLRIYVKRLSHSTGSTLAAPTATPAPNSVSN